MLSEPMKSAAFQLRRGGAPRAFPWRAGQKPSKRTRVRFQGRSGYVRLALKCNTPIVPIIAVGGHSTALILDDLSWLAEAIGAKSKLRLGSWPLMLSFPWGLTLGPVILPYLPWPSKTIIEVLDPIVLPPASSAGVSEKAWVEQCAQRVERTIEDALTRLEAERVSKQHGLMHKERVPGSPDCGEHVLPLAGQVRQQEGPGRARGRERSGVPLGFQRLGRNPLQDGAKLIHGAFEEGLTCLRPSRFEINLGVPGFKK